MKVIVAEHFGMCFGVRDAIAEATRLADEGPLTILGELVHNPVAREQLRARGVREASMQTPVSGSERYMITAHGVSDVRRTAWKATGATVVDGTCPVVRRAHEQLRALVAAGFFPVVIGKAGHVEVQGLTEDFNAAVIAGVEDIERLRPRSRYGIISQTTQPIEYVRELVESIRKARPEAEVRFVDTVCRPTKDRQSALRQLIYASDIVIVVGGRGSNNTRQLAETCRAAGRRAIHVERHGELDPNDFKGVETVGVTAGTSTMSVTVEEVIRRLRKISSEQQDSSI